MVSVFKIQPLNLPDSFIDRFFDADEAHDLVFWRVVSRYSGNDKKVWKRIKV